MSENRTAYDDTSNPILTTDPNIRAWIRHRRKAAFYAELASEALEGVAKMSRSPWSDVRPAIIEDIAPGAVLWRPTTGTTLGGGQRYDWFYVERVSATQGSFVDHEGRVHTIDGMMAEVESAEAIRRTRGIERLMGGHEISCFAQLLQVLGNHDDQRASIVYVSEEFASKLTAEAERLDLCMSSQGVRCAYGARIEVDDKLEGSAMRFVGDGSKTLFDPEGLKVDDLDIETD